MTMAKRVKEPTFLTVPGLDRKLTVLDIAPDGQQILWRKPYSELPFDGFLERVLAWWEGQFVVWYWNHQTGGFCDGHYFTVFMYEKFQDPQLAALMDAIRCFDRMGPRTEIAERMMNYINPQTGNKEVA